MIPAAVVHEEGGVGETYAGVFSPNKERKGVWKFSTRLVPRSERILSSSCKVLPSWAYMGTATGSLRHPFAMCTRRFFTSSSSRLWKNGSPVGVLERAKRAQHIPENKVSANCKAQLHTLTTLDAREKLCRVQRLFKHLRSTHPYSIKDIVVLLCAAKQYAVVLMLRGCTDPDSLRPERGV